LLIGPDFHPLLTSRVTNPLDIGFNTTITLQSHKGSIPGLPDLGEALSKIPFDIQIPQLHIPRNDDGEEPGEGDGEDDDGKLHFIKDATVLSSLIDTVS
jgi:hypothetical protein